MKRYKVSELEVGKMYQCVLSGRKILVIMEDREYCKTYKSGLFYNTKKQDYVYSPLYDGQMTDIAEELRGQLLPVLKGETDKF